MAITVTKKSNQVHDAWTKLMPLDEPFKIQHAAFVINEEKFLVVQGSRINVFNIAFNEWTSKDSKALPRTKNAFADQCDESTQICFVIQVSWY